MEGYESNTAYLLDYITLFKNLIEKKVNTDDACLHWQEIMKKEAATKQGIFAPYLRAACALTEDSFLLVMVALALELDGGLRLKFRREYGREQPDLEFGFRFIEQIYALDCSILAQALSNTMLTELLLKPMQWDGYALERPLLLTRAAAAFLSGGVLGDAPWRHVLWPEMFLPIQKYELLRIRQWMNTEEKTALLLCGHQGTGRRTLLRRAAAEQKRPIVCADLQHLSTLSPDAIQPALCDITLSAVLLHAPVCMLNGEPNIIRQQLSALCRKYHVLHAVLLERVPDAGQDTTIICLKESLSLEDSKKAWHAFSGECIYNADVQAARYRLPIREIQEVTLQAAREAHNTGVKKPGEKEMRQAIQERGGSPDFGIFYDFHVTFQDLVLPKPVLEQLFLLCSSAEHRTQLTDWGFAPARGGMTAVFHGPSGTGKTMAASVIAHQLGMPLLRADLAGLMDKYIGETEKHLEHLFQTAKERNCVLFFDEADALFGKRTSVTSAHDKYANVSTSYLLQELERYDGVALLSTNLLQNFDEAFLRRLRFVIKFPFPDTALREALWKRAFPDPARCTTDVNPALLAQAELSPARIYETARAAAIAAIAAGQKKITLSMCVTAIRAELSKNGKLLPTSLEKACI